MIYTSTRDASVRVSASEAIAKGISADGGRLVVEDPAYCAQVSFDLGDWIDMIVGNK